MSLQLAVDYGSMGHLFVHKDHGWKGLAQSFDSVCACMFIQIANDGQIPTSVVEKENTVSVSLFMSLGFVEADSKLAVAPVCVSNGGFLKLHV